MAKRVTVAASKDRVMGIDVSRWQKNINLAKVFLTNPGIKFCICRTGDGKDKDALFKHFYSHTVASEVIPGSYHYFRADRDGKTQAESMSAQLREVGYIPGVHLPPVVDFEDGSGTNLPGGVYNGAGKVMPIHQIHEELMEFLTELENIWGVTPMLYTGQTFHWWMSQAQPELAQEYGRFPLWTPSYTSNATKYNPRMPADRAGKPFPWAKPTIWQHTGKGRIPGYAADLDLNFFMGDMDELRRFIQNGVIAQQGTAALDYTDAKLSAIDTMAAELQRLRGLVEGDKC